MDRMDCKDGSPHHGPTGARPELQKQERHQSGSQSMEEDVSQVEWEWATGRIIHPERQRRERSVGRPSRRDLPPEPCRRDPETLLGPANRPETLQGRLAFERRGVQDGVQRPDHHQVHPIRT